MEGRQSIHIHRVPFSEEEDILSEFYSLLSGSFFCQNPLKTRDALLTLTPNQLTNEMNLLDKYPRTMDREWSPPEANHPQSVQYHRIKINISIIIDYLMNVDKLIFFITRIQFCRIKHTQIESSVDTKSLNELDKQKSFNLQVSLKNCIA